MPSTDPLRAWLDAFSAALASLPPNDHHEIRREVEEHLKDRLAQGMSPERVPAGFGDASKYATEFLDEFALTQARASGRTIKMFVTLAAYARKSLRAGIGLAAAIGCVLWTVGSLTCILLKIADPRAVGLWIDRPLNAPHRYVHVGAHSIPLRLGSDHIQFGYANPPPAVPEALGPWMYPALLGMAVVGYIALRYTLITTLKALGRKRS